VIDYSKELLLIYLIHNSLSLKHKANFSEVNLKNPQSAEDDEWNLAGAVRKLSCPRGIAWTFGNNYWH